jgi:chemotaxis protein histidine kinase CheA
MADISSNLLPIFIAEAEEKLGILEQCFATMKAGEPCTKEALENAFRAAHSIKGTAALIKLPATSSVAKRLEDTLEEYLENGVMASPAEAKALRFAFDQLVQLVKKVAAGEKEPANIPAVVECMLNSALQEEGQAEPPEKLRPGEENAIEGSREKPQSPEPQRQPARLAAGTERQLGAGGKNAADEQAPEEVKPEISCCHFRVARRDFHLPIGNMVEIADIPEITYLPMAPPYIRGLANLRGEVMPIVDLGILHDTPSAFNREWHLIVAMARGERLAFLAEGIPNLSPEAHGEMLDVVEFIRHYGVKSA